MPRKVFTAGEVLSASNVNNFLMDQSVMTFAGTAARSSAIGTATEGMVTWLNDSNSLEVYDGTQWNGLAASGGNAVINGGFDINQRSFSSSTVSTTYGFDRWFQQNSSGATFSAQTFTPGAAPVAGYEAANHVRVVTSGQSGTSAIAQLRQNIEDVRTFAGQTITVSFWAKAASGTPSMSIEIGQNFGSGGSPSSSVLGSVATNTTKKIAITTSWTRYSATLSVPSISGKTIGTTPNSSYLALFMWVSAGSDYSVRTDSLGVQNNTFDIWGVQVEAGPTANVFRRNANSLQGELAACQRYYQRYAGAGDPPQSPVQIDLANRPEILLFFSEKRVAPSITVTNPSGMSFNSITSSSGLTISTFQFALSTTTVSANLFFSGTWTAYVPGTLYLSNSSTFIEINAEL